MWVKVISGVILSLTLTSAFAQNYEGLEEKKFAYRVKILDDFIDRFNGKKPTEFTNYLHEENPKRPVTRDFLLKGLFAPQLRAQNLPNIISFMNEVTDKQNPSYLNFFGDKWDTELKCAVIWRGRPKTVSLKLKLVKGPNDGYKWVVSNVSAPFLRSSKLPNSGKTYNTVEFQQAKDSTACLDPLSYTTWFSHICDITADRENIGNYYIHAAEYSDDLPLFVAECLKGHLSVIRTDEMNFNFTQVKGWSFRIKDFAGNQKSGASGQYLLTSGWLISSLNRTDAE